MPSAIITTLTATGATHTDMEGQPLTGALALAFPNTGVATSSAAAAAAAAVVQTPTVEEPKKKTKKLVPKVHKVGGYNVQVLVEATSSEDEASSSAAAAAVEVPEEVETSWLTDYANSQLAPEAEVEVPVAKAKAKGKAKAKAKSMASTATIAEVAADNDDAPADNDDGSSDDSDDEDDAPAAPKAKAKAKAKVQAKAKATPAPSPPSLQETAKNLARLKKTTLTVILRRLGWLGPLPKLVIHFARLIARILEDESVAEEGGSSSTTAAVAEAPTRAMLLKNLTRINSTTWTMLLNRMAPDLSVPTEKNIQVVLLEAVLTANDDATDGEED